MHWQAVDTVPIRMGHPVTAARGNAIGVALLKRALPLSRLHDGQLEPLATAALVRDGERAGLLTAAHIFERAQVGDLAVPLPRDGTLVQLHAARVRIAVHPQSDVAILWIGNASAAQRLCANWESSSMRGLTTAEPARANYVLAGYPACNARRVDGCVYVKPLVLFTSAIDSQRYLYSRTAERLDGLTIWTPELDGVSGATLWSVSEDEGNDVSCVLRPAAVQTAFLHSAHLRAESIGSVLDLLKH